MKIRTRLRVDIRVDGDDIDAIIEALTYTSEESGSLLSGTMRTRMAAMARDLEPVRREIRGDN